MPRKSKKFAVPWNISVPKELYDRARKTQQEWDQISVTKFDKRFRMSDLGTIALEIGLEVLEALPKPTVLDTIAKEEISEDTLKVEVKKAKRSLKSPRTLSNLTDEQIEAMSRPTRRDNSE